MLLLEKSKESKSMQNENEADTQIQIHLALHRSYVTSYCYNIAHTLETPLTSHLGHTYIVGTSPIIASKPDNHVTIDNQVPETSESIPCTVCLGLYTTCVMAKQTYICLLRRTHAIKEIARHLARISPSICRGEQP